MSSSVIIFVLLLWGAACAIRDAQNKCIDNWLTYPLALLALLHLAITGYTPCNANVIEAIASVLLVLLFTLPGYYRSMIGAGDIKMLLALALATAVTPILVTFSVAALALLCWRYCGPLVWPYVPEKIKDAFSLPNYEQKTIAYAPYLFTGMLIALTTM